MREECLKRLRAQVAAGKPIIGGGAGTGISAKCAEAGGIDLLIIYNSGRFRMAGRGSMSGMMPYGDANAIVMDMAREVLPVVKKTPVLAGVCGTDPFRIMKLFLRDVQAAGFSGVQNFPTVGLIDGLFRQNLEETEMGFGLEVDMIHTAAEMGLLTCPYVFNEDEARAMTNAGADVLIPHMGLTTKGTIGAHTAMTLQQAAQKVQAIADAAKKVRPDILVLCHGGPISEPEDAQYVIRHTTGIVGFFGASSIERLPTEVAITGCVRKFKDMALLAARKTPLLRAARHHNHWENDEWKASAAHFLDLPSSRWRRWAGFRRANPRSKRRASRNWRSSSSSTSCAAITS